MIVKKRILDLRSKNIKKVTALKNIQLGLLGVNSSDFAVCYRSVGHY